MIIKLFNKYHKLFLIIAIILLTFSLSLFHILDPDTMNYLSYGKYTWENGLIKTCIFTYTLKTCPIPYSEWLFHLVIYLVFLLGKFDALVILQSILIMTTVAIALLHNLKNKVSSISIALISIPAILVMSERFMLRTDLISLSLAAAAFYILTNYFEQIVSYHSHEKKLYLILGLFSLQLLWANSHGSFPLGIIILLAFILPKIFFSFFSYKKRLITKVQFVKTIQFSIALLTASLLGSLINPYGANAFFWPIRNILTTSTTTVIRTISEYQSPLPPFEEFTRTSIWMYRNLITISIFLVLGNIKRLKFSQVFLYFTFLLLSIEAVRYVALFGLFCLLILPEFLDGMLSKIYHLLSILFKVSLIDKILPLFRISISLVLIFIFSLLVFRITSNQFYFDDRSMRRFGIGLSKIAYPEAAAKFILDNNLSGNMFNSYGFGAYFNFMLFPKYKTFIHGSILDFDMPETVELYNHYYETNMGKLPLSEIINKYAINFLVINHVNPTTDQLIKKLHQDKTWVPIYLDYLAIIFVADKPENKKIIDRYKINFSADQIITPSSTFNTKYDQLVVYNALGNFYGKLDLYDKSIQIFEKAIEIEPRSYPDYNNIGLAYRFLNEPEKAIQYFKKSIEVKPDYGQAHHNLATIYVVNKNYSQALKEYQSALKYQSNFPGGNYNIGLIYELTNEKELARKYYQKELKLYPDHQLAKDGLTRLALEIMR